jgi:hypothetical protein
LRAFRPSGSLKGEYRTSRWVRNRISTEEVIIPNRVQYDSEAAYALIVQTELFKDPDAVVLNHLLNVPTRGKRAARTRIYKSFPCVIAPWLKKCSMDSEWAMFCQTSQIKELDACMEAYGSLRGYGRDWDKAEVETLRTRSEHEEHIKTHMKEIARKETKILKLKVKVPETGIN